jgi:hypothetical protein
MATPRNSSTLQSRFGFQDPDLITPQHDSIVLWLVNHAGEAVDRLRKHAVDLLPQQRKNILALKADVEQVRKRNQDEVEYQNQRRSLTQRDDGSQPDWVREQIERPTRELAATEGKLADLDERLRHLPANHWVPVTEQVQLKRSEHPILSGNYTIGFVDLYVATQRNELWLPCYQQNYKLPEPRPIETRPGYYFEVKPQIRSFGELVRQLRMYESYIDKEARLAVVSPDTRFAAAISGEGFPFLAITPDAAEGWKFA